MSATLDALKPSHEAPNGAVAALVDAIASAVEVAEQSRAPELKQAVDSGSLLVAAGYSRAIPGLFLPHRRHRYRDLTAPQTPNVKSKAMQIREHAQGHPDRPAGVSGGVNIYPQEAENILEVRLPRTDTGKLYKQSLIDKYGGSPAKA